MNELLFSILSSCEAQIILDTKEIIYRTFVLKLRSSFNLAFPARLKQLEMSNNFSEQISRLLIVWPFCQLEITMDDEVISVCKTGRKK